MDSVRYIVLFGKEKGVERVRGRVSGGTCKLTFAGRRKKKRKKKKFDRGHCLL
jgi:hypothetical protein